MTMPKKTKPRVECPVCGKPAAVRSNGQLVKHGITQNRDGGLQKSKACAGSGRQVYPSHG
jgi:hypothetical protein